MKIKSYMLAGTMALGVMGLAMSPAGATEVDCTGDFFAPVATAITTANFLSKRAWMDEANLLTKLEAAMAKYGFEKYSDSVDKLMDISDKATALANATKPKLEDATEINNAVGDAIYCVRTTATD